MDLIETATQAGCALACGDCREVMRDLPDNSVDSIVTDPPYELGFMGKAWDSTGIAYNVEVWRECLRVLKPGGHLLAFGGSRTYHRLACAIEDAGFEIRDQIQWIYGSGFPKSHDVSKAIDKAAGAEREIVGSYKATGTARTMTGGNYGGGGANVIERDVIYQTAPATDAARQWAGWGTALKPAHEPIVVARKPLIGTVAENVLAHGTGAINVYACRVDGGDSDSLAKNWDRETVTDTRGGNYGNGISRGVTLSTHAHSGRWPANVIHDGSDEVTRLFPVARSSGVYKKGSRKRGSKIGPASIPIDGLTSTAYSDVGSAARFFYCAKASKADRDEGLDDFEPVHRANGNKWTDQDYRVARGDRPPSAESGPRRNHHPTVKPVDLMRYLVRLVTPLGGVVLDPFTGSGGTGKAAMIEGFRFIGVELMPEHIEIARARISAATPDAPVTNVNTSAQVYTSDANPAQARLF